MMNFMITDSKEKTDLYLAWSLGAGSATENYLGQTGNVATFYDTKANIDYWGKEQEEGWTVGKL